MLLFSVFSENDLCEREMEHILGEQGSFGDTVIRYRLVGGHHLHHHHHQVHHHSCYFKCDKMVDDWRHQLQCEVGPGAGER